MRCQSGQTLIAVWDQLLAAACMLLVLTALAFMRLSSRWRKGNGNRASKIAKKHRDLTVFLDKTLDCCKPLVNFQS